MMVVEVISDVTLGAELFVVQLTLLSNFLLVFCAEYDLIRFGRGGCTFSLSRQLSVYILFYHAHSHLVRPNLFQFVFGLLSTDKAFQGQIVVFILFQTVLTEAMSTR